MKSACRAHQPLRLARQSKRVERPGTFVPASLFCFIDVLFDPHQHWIWQRGTDGLELGNVDPADRWPHLYNPFWDDKIHDMTTKGVIIWNKVNDNQPCLTPWKISGVQNQRWFQWHFLVYTLADGLQPLQTSSLVLILESYGHASWQSHHESSMSGKDFPSS